VATSAAENFDRQRTQSLLEWLLRNGRREKLCAEVAKLTAAPHALVEDVFQEVCVRASNGGCHGQSQGEVYNWLRTATLRRVREQLKTGPQRRELPVDWAADRREPQDASAGADVEVLEREKRHELGELVETALAELDEAQRKVAVLHAYGFKGPEIAHELHLSRKRVQRLKEQMLAGARDALATHAGAGCDHGDGLVRRLAFGLANAREHAEAEVHMASCEPCAAVYRRLELWHDKVAALLPVPAAAQTDPGLVERTLHKTADALASLKQQAAQAGTQAKQQLADAAGQAKQHAAAGYTRAAEYTPIASVRPGAAAAAIAGCLAVGGGAAGYCIDRGVDPITGLVDVVQPSPAKPAQAPPEQKPPAEQPPDPPQLAAPAPTQAPPEPKPTAPAPAPEQQAAAPAPAPAQPAPPPPPPPEPTPPAVQFGEPATPAQAAPSTPAPSPQPAPAPSGGTDLYGP
jgi:RNA polymerase sigma factor (sigma-70 family)